MANRKILTRYVVDIVSDQDETAVPIPDVTTTEEQLEGVYRGALAYNGTNLGTSVEMGYAMTCVITSFKRAKILEMRDSTGAVIYDHRTNDPR